MLNLMSAERKNKSKKQIKQERKPAPKPVQHLGFKLHEPCPEHTIEICNLGPGEFLGEIEALCQLKQHLFNAVCMTTTVVYEVDLLHVEQLLHKKAPRTLYCILQHIIQKIESWKERHQCVQFFAPLTRVLEQMDKGMMAEGANKPIRRQHNYDACTLALMAARSLGRPVTSTCSRSQTRSVAFAVHDSTKDANCTPFSSLYGSVNASPHTSPKMSVKRCLSSPANIVMSRRLLPDSLDDNSPPFPHPVDGDPKPRVRHPSAPLTSSRRIPKPLLKKKFSFDCPPPRKYRTRPNLVSSVRFPVPPPSPYPSQEDQSDYLKLSDHEGEQSEDDLIETISLGSSPKHKEMKRCMSASQRRICTRSPLPIRPNTAVPFYDKSRSVTPIRTDDLSPLSTPSRKVEELVGHTPSDVSISEHMFGNDERSLAADVSLSPLRPVTTTPIVIPLATTSESDHDLCDVARHKATDEVTLKEETVNTDKMKTGQGSDSLANQAADEALNKATTENGSINTCPSAENGRQKHVKISNKVEFLGPNSSVHTNIYGTYLLPMTEIGNSQRQQTEGNHAFDAYTEDVFEIPLADTYDKSRLYESENSTTIPEEYARLQESSRRDPKSSTLKSMSPNGVHDTADQANVRDQECDYRYAIATATTSPVQMGASGERYRRELIASPAYKCIAMSFTTPMDYHTR